MRKCSFRRRYKDTISSHCVYCELSLQLSSSGNKFIDKFVKETFTAPRASSRNKRLEYVPYEQFTNIKYLSEGGFSKIYKATWKDGPITSWNNYLGNDCKPFFYHEHNSCLILNIIKGLLRPEILTNTPSKFAELMVKCWNADPSKRPTQMNY
ncbi:hypothetical protein C2G38_2244852 [Gigaspora rosea]|uniref:Serine-threonine/tyrosine-protein kinase catalytic domain-containing protein n=1 Tax=Gigaspora rosea TaxID=44941 RepID=A0A397VDP7_9GLOM|nr:hypothetical protein C2G38_2244852 [Gigaspora rosea]